MALSPQDSTEAVALTLMQEWHRPHSTSCDCSELHSASTPSEGKSCSQTWAAIFQCVHKSCASGEFKHSYNYSPQVPKNDSLLSPLSGVCSTQILLPSCIYWIRKKTYLCKQASPRHFTVMFLLNATVPVWDWTGFSLQVVKQWHVSHYNSKHKASADITQKHTQIPQNPSLSPMG